MGSGRSWLGRHTGMQAPALLPHPQCTVWVSRGALKAYAAEHSSTPNDTSAPGNRFFSEPIPAMPYKAQCFQGGMNAGPTGGCSPHPNSELQPP